MELETDPPKTPFRFLDLIPELRNAIYELVYPPLLTSPSLAINIADIRTLIPSPALTLVSHQLRTESLPYYHNATTALWQNGKFILNLNRSDDINFLNQARLDPLIGPRLLAVRKIDVFEDGKKLYGCIMGLDQGVIFTFDHCKPRRMPRAGKVEDTIQLIDWVVRDQWEGLANLRP